MTYQTISVKPISGALGAIVEGVDLSQDFDNATASACIRRCSTIA